MGRKRKRGHSREPEVRGQQGRNTAPGAQRGLPSWAPALQAVSRPSTRLSASSVVGLGLAPARMLDTALGFKPAACDACLGVLFRSLRRLRINSARPGADPSRST